MSNSQTEHSKKRRAANANATNKAKLASGVYKVFSVTGKAEDVDAIRAAIAIAGGSNLAALSRICREWAATQQPND